MHPRDAEAGDAIDGHGMDGCVAVPLAGMVDKRAIASLCFQMPVGTALPDYWRNLDAGARSGPQTEHCVLRNARVASGIGHREVKPAPGFRLTLENEIDDRLDFGVVALLLSALMC